MNAILTDRDRVQLEKTGISLEEAARQLRHLDQPGAWVKLDRPCTPGDGIRVLDASETAQLSEAFEAAAAQGRFQWFVPASGAASRMFQPLFKISDAAVAVACACAAGGSPEGLGAADKALVEFFAALERLAFYPELTRALGGAGLDIQTLRAQGDLRTLARCILEDSGLGYANLPKGVLLFHNDPAGPRTPFEEHLREAARLCPAAACLNLHFTVSPQHEPLFRCLLEALRPALEQALGTAFSVSFSYQESATDTLAVDQDGQPVRTADGSLLLRPAGHGALIPNLDNLQGDFIFIKNIDNVVPDERKGLILPWRRALGGLLAQLSGRVCELLGRLEDESDEAAAAEALAFIRDGLGDKNFAQSGPDRGAIKAKLDRPLRVCGMVRNVGEPGGGPYWAQTSDGQVSPQIVESAQVDMSSAQQKTIFQQSTHFNPVDLVCSVRRPDGRPYRLTDFIDNEAVILTIKSNGAESLKALERPGLWNGGMAYWNTVMVEIPLETFNPVKTVFDLLRPAHQPLG